MQNHGFSLTQRSPNMTNSFTKIIVHANARYFSDSVEIYQQQASVYRSRMHALFIENFLRYLDPLSPLPVLEVGPGAGLLVDAVLAAGLRSTALDVSEPMLRTLTASVTAQGRGARKRFEPIYGDVLDATVLGRRRFQAVVIQAVIHLFPQRNALETVRRLCMRIRRGGYLWIATTVGQEAPEGFYIDANWRRPARLGNPNASFRAFHTRGAFLALVERSEMLVVREIENIDAERDHRRRWLVVVARRL